MGPAPRLEGRGGFRVGGGLVGGGVLVGTPEAQQWTGNPFPLLQCHSPPLEGFLFLVIPKRWLHIKDPFPYFTVPYPPSRVGAAKASTCPLFRLSTLGIFSISVPFNSMPPSSTALPRRRSRSAPFPALSWARAPSLLSFRWYPLPSVSSAPLGCKLTFSSDPSDAFSVVMMSGCFAVFAPFFKGPDHSFFVFFFRSFLHPSSVTTPTSL